MSKKVGRGCLLPLHKRATQDFRSRTVQNSGAIASASTGTTEKEARGKGA